MTPKERTAVARKIRAALHREFPTLPIRVWPASGGVIKHGKHVPMDNVVAVEYYARKDAATRAAVDRLLGTFKDVYVCCNDVHESFLPYLKTA